MYLLKNNILKLLMIIDAIARVISADVNTDFEV